MPKAKPTEPRPTQFESIEQIERGIKKFTRLLAKVQALDPATISHDDQIVSNLETEFHALLAEVFGVESVLYHRLQYPRIWDGSTNYSDSDAEQQHKFRAGIPRTVTQIEGLITHLNEQKEDFVPPKAQVGPPPKSVSRPAINIHGGVDKLALGDINETHISFVNLLTRIADAVENSDAIPPEEKESLREKLRALVNNPYMVSLGSASIVELAQKAASFVF